MAKAGQLFAQSSGSIEAGDRVFITNEDSNTIVVIDPRTNTVETTINLTSFDEDARPPFRFVTAGVAPTHAAMIHKPLYHGCIDAHGAVPSPDGKLLATTGRGSSNVYLIDAVNKRVIGNVSNPAAGPTTNPERLSSGILIGREPHEPTFTRNGKELWVTLRGEDRIVILDVERMIRQLGGVDVNAVLRYVPTISGSAQAWFSADGKIGIQMHIGPAVPTQYGKTFQRCAAHRYRKNDGRYACARLHRRCGRRFYCHDDPAPPGRYRYGAAVATRRQ